jgi:hypothetical protein
MTNANGNSERKVSSLRELPQEIQPRGDLWAGIEARINAERNGTAASDLADAGGGGRKRFVRVPLQRWMAVAATIAALAVGVWIGRNELPTKAPSTPLATRSATQILQAAYMSDPKYRQDRAALVKSLEAKLNSLPPDSRAKVMSSLATIHKSIHDLEDALGKDPTNALLQGLLLDTYQDEMRVLTTVQDASDAGKGI